MESIKEEVLYETIGRLVMYKEMLEKQVETLKRNLVEQLNRSVKVEEGVRSLKEENISLENDLQRLE